MRRVPSVEERPLARLETTGSVSPMVSRRRFATSQLTAILFWAIAVILPLAFLGLFFISPVVNLFVRGFAMHDAGEISPLARILTSPRTLTLLRNTIWQTLLGTSLSVLFGVPIAYLLYRTQFRFAEPCKH